MKGLGYAIGMLVFIPMMLYIINNFFLKGNGAKEEEVTAYIKSSLIDTIVLPKDYIEDKDKFTPRIRRGGGTTAYYRKYIYFNKEYHKFLSMGLFYNFEPKGQGVDRWYILRPPSTISVRINKTQLANPAYGTQENPVPVFPIDILNKDHLVQEMFHVSDTVNRIFVQQYLNHFMPKEEFKTTFRKK